MSSFPRLIAIDPPVAPQRALTGWRAKLETDRADAVLFPLVMGVILALYLLLVNPYWVPAGDSELYTAVARSLARGEGYVFNGQPVAMIPPGWAILMAGVMKLTPFFLPLKLLAMGCMLASLACGYWILRRFAPARQVAVAILLTAILSHVYQATYWLISEGAFCLSVSAGILVAMQIGEGKRASWRIPLVLFLAIAAVSIRWAGVLSMLLTVAALLDRQWRPRWDARWVTAALVVIVSAGSFFAMREALKPTAEQLAAARDLMTGTGEDTGVTVEEPPVTGTANQTAKAYQLIPRGSVLDRFLNWGRWFSWLYWQPFRAAAGGKLLGAFASLLGWVLLGLLLVVVLVATAQRRWLWPATSLYCAILALGWTNVNARYYVPVAFLLTLAVLLASQQLQLWIRDPRWRTTVAWGWIVFAASVLLCNGLLYGTEVSVARSASFAQRYETGMNMSLVAVADYLRALPGSVKDGEVAVSGRYTNLNRSRPSPFALRALALLMDSVITTPRYKITDVPPYSGVRNGRQLRAWLLRTGAKWYVWQPPISPWRVWHFRLGWYERWVTGQEPASEDTRWRLYRVEPERGKDSAGESPDCRLIEVAVPPVQRYPTRVPGL